MKPIGKNKIIMKIDSHVHFWQYSEKEYPWIGTTMSGIRRDFIPTDAEPIFHRHGIAGCIAVQARQNEAENEFMLSLAKRSSFIKGIVGWVPLKDKSLQSKLEAYAQQPLIRGFRHVIQDEPLLEFMLDPSFIRGLRLLHHHNYCYDLLIKPSHLPVAAALVRLLPAQPIVIDHIAKPDIARGEFTRWAKDIQRLASFDNIYCKVSGMTTEARWKEWSENDFRPYLDTVVESFGLKRLIYGSDWPVCLLSTDYEQQLRMVENYFRSFSKPEQASIFGLNALEFYKIA
ncbi:amidohydrolase family protein [Chryseolinea lacunae]|uniref:Amidohydrolase family protein n=1 Tax=Chryseolinea lacunae TaxID=2801331 RepID=A0ABS1L498_9BACT|nr:amidohydrolase family protein [Chryseolinea lacunae]MBL0745762.1 amidohydrolase family protein [Chryseolinea lacunae]